MSSILEGCEGGVLHGFGQLKRIPMELRRFRADGSISEPHSETIAVSL